jgi:hypothetical protein
MFGRLQLYIIGGIMLFGVLSGIYYSWRKGIEREALLEYNQQQLEQNVKDQEAMRKQLQDINDKQKEIEAENAEVKKKFKDQMDIITTDLSSKETAATDRPASDVLKKTVNKLKDVVK